VITNEMAKALAEKVFGEFTGISYSTGKDYPYAPYRIVCDENTMGKGFSWEEAFLSAGVKVCYCKLGGPTPLSEHDKGANHIPCSGLGYTLVKGAKR